MKTTVSMPNETLIGFVMYLMPARDPRFLR
jgi:hypothetical protein